jgi:zinc finger protein ubi-d4
MALKISTTTTPSEINLNIPTKNIENIEKLLHDSTYTELIEFSATFNTRLRIERKMRFPFLDPQTGVAQKHSNLFMKKAQRIPGLREGQIYTYPSFRWRKAKRQYLNNPNSYPWNYRPFGRFRDNEHGMDIPVGGEFIPPSEENSFRPSFVDEHSKDSHKDEGSKGSGWYYDDMDMHEMDNFDDPEEDSDDDFMEPRSGRKKRAGAGGGGGGGRSGGGSSRRRNNNNDQDARRGNRGRGRKKPNSNAMDNNSNSSDKFNEYSRRRSNLPPQVQTIHNPNPTSLDEAIPEHRIPTTERGKTHFSEEERSSINTTATTSGGGLMATSSGFHNKTPGDRNEKPRATPSPYCDFCLGDTKENKKTGVPEELVSCSDCGRSGHPTCLQFTENMIISVKKYRWQCIECKCCSLCGTSENDETLLFCDSCDAGNLGIYLI